jgi:hypothetical protein
MLRSPIQISGCIAWSGGFSGIGQFRQHADDPLEGDDRIASRIQPSQRSWR